MGEFMRWLAVLAFSLLAGAVVADEVCPDGECLPDDLFSCTKIARSSFVQRVCYYDVENYLVVTIRGTDYGYCDVSGDLIAAFEAAPSMGRFFNQRIKQLECGALEIDPADLYSGEEPWSYLDEPDY